MAKATITIPRYKRVRAKISGAIQLPPGVWIDLRTRRGDLLLEMAPRDVAAMVGMIARGVRRDHKSRPMLVDLSPSQSG